ncbi:MAG: 2-oxo acid dehydrogenase subunit E2 [Flavobacteriales bacterium]|nr:2-oxo acid dehydrogenase subunit E2 [Flavobacteriales bacterium]MCX7768089.1 2-oxo acid dehydrogenase subunit E2 [Flavobacteriales bacterium]MDW8410345.1 dihydrolipoamide acetyltransferase family protein [Flavobacteriales bacterium]
MAQVEVIMPKMGESVMEATITRWLKNEGDRVELDEMLVEIATDKVDSEVPSTAAGILVKKLYPEGSVVKIGEAFALIETGVQATTPDAGNGLSANTVTPPTSVTQPEPEILIPPTTPSGFGPSGHSFGVASTPAHHSEEKKFTGRFYSPLIRNIARQEGISQEELDRIPGTGKGGRLTKEDLMAYLAAGRNVVSEATHSTPYTNPSPEAKAPREVREVPLTSASSHTAIPIASPVQEPKGPPIYLQPGDEIVEMDRMRKLIAEHMVLSKRISPHVTSFVEVDMTNIVLWRERIKDKFFKETGEKITYTPIIIEAVVKAIKEMPGVNASVDGDRIILRKNINIGMATALPNGNLIVPVIKNADTMNLVGLTRAVNDLARRAREGKLLPDEVQGGTYTVSNVGTFGNVMGTPIINQPQVAILAIGAIRKKPAVLETPTGDVIAIRHMMFLSHSYDHRVIDGALGGSFVRRVADILEAFPLDRTY